MISFFTVILCLTTSLALPQLVTSQKTLPCPGFESEPFHNKPLSERPEFAKILQNGYRLAGQSPAPPTRTSPGNRVQLHTAFVQRPFRSLAAEHCVSPIVSNAAEYIGCTAVGATSFESSATASFPILVTEQAILQAALQSDLNYPRLTQGPFENSHWTADWSTAISDLLDTEFQCTDWSYLRITTQDYSCAVTTWCQEFEPEFLDNLNALPSAPWDETTAVAYRAFVTKWGHGAVNKFRLGGASLRVQSNQADGATTTVYMGYVGGAGIHDIMEGQLNASVYTDQDCADPEPVQVTYLLWNQFLNDFQTRHYLDTYNGIRQYYNLTDTDAPLVPNRSAIADNFFQLFLQEGLGLSSHLYDYPALLEPACESESPTTLPSTEAPTTSAPTTTMTPTHLRTLSPTAAPTEEATTETTIEETTFVESGGWDSTLASRRSLVAGLVVTAVSLVNYF